MKHSAAELLIHTLKSKGWKIRCVESCTTGNLTAAIGAIAGASDVLDRSWITYSNQAKQEEVHVPAELIATYGAVSSEVVRAMAEGAVKGCEENTVAISVSGIAGPGGGTEEKPVGTVWVTLHIPEVGLQTKCFHFQGSRQQIQEQAVLHSLNQINTLLTDIV